MATGVSFSGIFSQGFGLVVTVFFGNSGTVIRQGPSVAIFNQWYPVVNGSQDPIGTTLQGGAHYFGPVPPYGANYPQRYPESTPITDEDIKVQYEWRDSLGNITTSPVVTLNIFQKAWASGDAHSPGLTPVNQQPVLSLYMRVIEIVPKPIYTITHNLDTGIASATPAEGNFSWPSAAITCSATPSAGYTVVSVEFQTVGGASLGDTITPAENETYAVRAIAAKLEYDINVTVISNGIGNCQAARNLAALGYTSGGGAINGPGGTSAIVQAAGSASATGKSDYGNMGSVFASSNDVWTRLVSLVVNGTDYVNSPSGSLTDEFVFCGPNGICGGVYFKVDTDINAVATFIADQPCIGGTGANGHTPGPNGVPGGISPYPPGTGFGDPLNPGWPSHPGYPGDDIGGDNFGPMPPGGFGTSGTGGGGTGGGDGSTPGGDGSDGTGSGSSGSSGGAGGTSGSVNFPIGLDWSKDAQGLIIRWQDDNKKWSKEKYVGLVGRKELAAWIQPHGQFVSRRYEIIHVDSLPAVVVYLETEPEVME